MKGPRDRALFLCVEGCGYVGEKAIGQKFIDIHRVFGWFPWGEVVDNVLDLVWRAWLPRDLDTCEGLEGVVR